MYSVTPCSLASSSTALKAGAFPCISDITKYFIIITLNIYNYSIEKVDISKTAKELNVGSLTLKDIIDELSKPGRDPREDMPKPILRSDVLTFDDLQEGMLLTGTVRNVTDFGAFVDVGVKHDGLVHISEMSDKYIKNPSEVVSVGDIVEVKVIGIDREKQKVSLTMKK